jgi:membrane associated rhomboid family serine protease
MRRLQEDMRGDNIRICTIGLLMTAMLMWGCPAWMHHNGIHIALAHHFFHANLFHLAVNCLSIWAVFRKENRYSWTDIAVPFMCGTIAWFFSSADPVGASNFLFAIVGYRSPSLRSAWWKSSSTIIFLMTSMAMAFIPGVSFVTHIVSFALGCLCAGIARLINSIRHDYRRAAH